MLCDYLCYVIIYNVIVFVILQLHKLYRQSPWL